MSISRRIKLLLFKKEAVEKKDVIFFAVFFLVISVVFLGAKIFNVNLAGVGAIFFVISFSLLCLITWSMAGLAVLRSLFVVGASLTLMIFITQTYCGLPDIARTGDDALTSLFGFGLLYVGFLFTKSLHSELKCGLKRFEDIYAGKKPWIMVTLFAIFIGLFLWQLYQVMFPIVSNLCVYK